MGPHSSTLAWKIPWTEESGRLQSMGLWRVGQDWATSLSLFTFMHWRRKWQPTPVFLPGESQGWGSLVGCRLWVPQSQTRLKRLSRSRSLSLKKKSVTPRSCFAEYQNQKFVNDSWSLLSGSISNLFLYSIAQYWENSTLCWEVFVNKSLERSLESPLDCQEIKPVNPEGNQPWIFIGKTDAAAEASTNTVRPKIRAFVPRRKNRTTQ